MHNLRRPLDRLLHFVTLWPWPFDYDNKLLIGGQGIVMDYLCAKIGRLF